MASQSSLLTQKVNYDWSALRQASSGQEPVERPAQPVVSMVSAPAPAPKPDEVIQGLGPAAQAALVSSIAEEIIPIVTERLHAELATALDFALRNAAQRVRGDIERNLDANLRIAIAQAVSRRSRGA